MEEIGHQVLERTYWNFKSTHGIIAPEIQELQENVTYIFMPPVSGLW